MTALRTAAQQALEAMLNFPDDISDEMFESITALKAALVEDALQKFSDVNQELEAALAEHDKNLAGFKERKANWDIRAPRSPRDLQCKLAEETQERDRQRREYEEQRLAALAEPTLTQQMTDAGFTPRDNRLTCDECGGKFTRQMLPIHKCAALAEPVQDVKGCDVCEHPLYAGIKCRVCGRVTQAEPVQEPVANDDKVICPACCHQFRAIPPNVQQMMLDAGFEPPFTTPPQRKPLTEEEIRAIGESYTDEIWRDDGWSIDFARAVERAHGVGGEE